MTLVLSNWQHISACFLCLSAIVQHISVLYHGFYLYFKSISWFSALAFISVLTCLINLPSILHSFPTYFSLVPLVFNQVSNLVQPISAFFHWRSVVVPTYFSMPWCSSVVWFISLFFALVFIIVSLSMFIISSDIFLRSLNYVTFPGNGLPGWPTYKEKYTHICWSGVPRYISSFYQLFWAIIQPISAFCHLFQAIVQPISVFCHLFKAISQRISAFCKLVSSSLFRSSSWCLELIDFTVVRHFWSFYIILPLQLPFSDFRRPQKYWGWNVDPWHGQQDPQR